MPEFVADELFLDLPYVVLGGFAQFLIVRMRDFGADDPIVKRSFDLLNDLLVEEDHEVVNALETAVIEQLLDNQDIIHIAHSLFEEPGRRSLIRIANWNGEVGR